MACDIISDQPSTAHPVMTTSVLRSGSGSISAKFGDDREGDQMHHRGERQHGDRHDAGAVRLAGGQH
jgi:hypothetical protein